MVSFGVGRYVTGPKEAAVTSGRRVESPWLDVDLEARDVGLFGGGNDTAVPTTAAESSS